MVRNIGAYAIKAITQYGYDGIIVEAGNNAALTKCDADQQLPISMAGIDWHMACVDGAEPEIKPLALTEIVAEVIRYQSHQMSVAQTRLNQDIARILAIPYGMLKEEMLP